MTPTCPTFVITDARLRILSCVQLFVVHVMLPIIKKMLKPMSKKLLRLLKLRHLFA